MGHGCCWGIVISCFLHFFLASSSTFFMYILALTSRTFLSTIPESLKLHLFYRDTIDTSWQPAVILGGCYVK